MSRWRSGWAGDADAGPMHGPVVAHLAARTYSFYVGSLTGAPSSRECSSESSAGPGGLSANHAEEGGITMETKTNWFNVFLVVLHVLVLLMSIATHEFRTTEASGALP